MKITDRKKAIAKGERKYYTGRPCKRGHLALRNTLTGACTQCLADHQRAAVARVRAALGYRA
jgi:hypothetical protein